MFDLGPRDYDSRDDERHPDASSRGSRGGSGDRDRDDDWSQSETRTRDRDDNDGRKLGRGPGSDRQTSDEHGSDRRDDARWPERDRDHRERDVDPRDTFTRHLHLPRGLEREIVRDRDREYTLRGSESRMLATVGWFRGVSSRDLWGFGDGKRAFFWIKQGKPDPAAIHWGFVAANENKVHEFYEATISAGAKDNISPRARLEYYPGYYAADVFDPDGYSFEVVHKS